MLEASGLRNLITEFNIKNTRNEISWAKYPGLPKQYFADFIFASQNVRVKKFTVPYNEISDHLPMILEIDV